MLPSTSPMEALLACPPSPPWNLSSFTVETTFSSSCSRSDLPLSHQGAALAHLDSLSPYTLVLWTDGSIIFPFGKGGSGVLANCSLCGTEASLSFSAGPVWSSFSAEACAILQALLVSTAPTGRPLLSSDSRSVLTTLSSPRSFLLLKSLWQIRQELSSLSSCSIRLQWVRVTRFSRGTTRLISWPDGEHYSCPLQSLVVSLLLPLVSTLLFFRYGGVLSNLNSLTHRFPRFPPRNLCSLVALAMFSLVFAATNTAFCQILTSPGLAESRILPAAPADTHSRTPLISFYTVQLRALCAARFLATLCLFMTSGPGPGELPGFWGSMVFLHAPIPPEGVG